LSDIGRGKKGVEENARISQELEGKKMRKLSRNLPGNFSCNRYRAITAGEFVDRRFVRNFCSVPDKLVD